MTARVKFAWVLLWVTLINIPLSLAWYAKDEPPVILVLSWLAIAISAWDVLMTSKVKDDTSRDKD